MEITVFKKEYIEDAMSLAQSNYEAERRFSPALPESVAIPSLSPFAENGLGTAAFEKGKLVPPMRQVYSPLWGQMEPSKKITQRYMPE